MITITGISQAPANRVFRGADQENDELQWRAGVRCLKYLPFRSRSRFTDLRSISRRPDGIGGMCSDRLCTLQNKIQTPLNRKGPFPSISYACVKTNARHPNHPGFLVPALCSPGGSLLHARRRLPLALPLPDMAQPNRRTSVTCEVVSTGLDGGVKENGVDRGFWDLRL